MELFKWHAVINSDGTALAVYGAALLKEAEEQTVELQEGFPGLGVRLLTIERPYDARPHVGENISPVSCKGCGVYQNPVARMLGDLCGPCVRNGHALFVNKGGA